MKNVYCQYIYSDGTFKAFKYFFVTIQFFYTRLPNFLNDIGTTMLFLLALYFIFGRCWRNISTNHWFFKIYLCKVKTITSSVRWWVYWSWYFFTNKNTITKFHLLWPNLRMPSFYHLILFSTVQTNFCSERRSHLSNSEIYLGFGKERFAWWFENSSKKDRLMTIILLQDSTFSQFRPKIR